MDKILRHPNILINTCFFFENNVQCIGHKSPEIPENWKKKVLKFLKIEKKMSWNVFKWNYMSRNSWNFAKFLADWQKSGLFLFKITKIDRRKCQIYHSMHEIFSCDSKCRVSSAAQITPKCISYALLRRNGVSVKIALNLSCAKKLYISAVSWVKIMNLIIFQWTNTFMKKIKIKSTVKNYFI